MPERLDIYVHRRRSGCGAFALYWLALTVVYGLVGIVGVWIVLGIGCVAVILAAAGRGRGAG
jgi:hypothetical protein